MKEERTKKLLRLKEVLQIIPVSRSVWYRGMDSGKFPRPIKLSPQTVAWRSEDIWACFDELYAQARKNEVAA